MADADDTRILLERWHGGDRPAIEALIQRDLPWIHGYVSSRLGALLRGRGETQDYVQDTMIEVLTYCPRFVTGSRDQFRALVARIIENRLRDAHDHHAAGRRDPARERPLPSDSALDLDRPHPVTQPGTAAERSERDAWLQLAIELLDPEDRRVLLLRQWQELEFEAIGRELGISADAARFRFQRALPRLAQKLAELRQMPTAGGPPAGSRPGT